MDILQRLIQAGVLSEENSERAQVLLSSANVSYEEALMQVGVPKDIVRMELAREFGVESFTLGSEETIKEDILRYIPEESARHYKIVPLQVTEGVLCVGVNDPDNLQIREVLNFVSTKHNLPYKFLFMLLEDIEKVLSFYESLTGEIGEALVSLDVKLDGEVAAQNEADAQSETNLSHIKEDAPVTKVVATVLRYAVDGGASDIHIEPIDDKVIVRFRVDGLLAKSLELPKNVQSAVIARV